MRLKYLVPLLAGFFFPSEVIAQPKMEAPAAEPAPLKIVRVASVGALRQAAREALPGTRIEIAPGTYSGSLLFERVRGEADRRITVAGADAENPPIFKGGMQFSDPAFLSLQDIAIEDSPRNGLNIDDGGDYDNSAIGLVLRRVRVSNGRGEGNSDGIKLSGVKSFRVENCTVERWGRGGAGIDMVGCHDGVIRDSVLRHDADLEKTGATGIQAKGGCRDIAIQRCRFENAGTRAINIGGSTGLEYFRPPLNNWFKDAPFFEAKDIVVENSTFIGHLAPISFAGVDGALVRFNVFYRPRKWAMRILQETTSPGFVPSRNGVWSDNIVVWNSSGWSSGGVNIGPNTDAKSFRFARNFWLCENRPERSRPNLPSEEVDGTYGQDPQFVDAANGDFRLKPDSPARNAGPQVVLEDTGNR